METPTDKDIRYTVDPLAEAIVGRVYELYRRGEGSYPRVVLEPSAGGGAFVRALKAVGASIDAIEPQESERETLKALGAGTYTGTLEDFASTVGVDDYDLVIGNPPFSLAEAHIRLLLKGMAGGAYLAFLLRNTFFGSHGRVEFWKEFPVQAYIPIVPRPSFTGKGTDMTEYGIFVWIAGAVNMKSLILPPLVWREPRNSR